MILREGHIARLAKLFEVGAAMLHEQFADHKLVAERFFNSTRCTTAEAWTEALASTGKRAWC